MCKWKSNVLKFLFLAPLFCANYVFAKDVHLARFEYTVNAGSPYQTLPYVLKNGKQTVETIKIVPSGRGCSITVSELHAMVTRSGPNYSFKPNDKGAFVIDRSIYSFNLFFEQHNWNNATCVLDIWSVPSDFYQIPAPDEGQSDVAFSIMTASIGIKLFGMLLKRNEAYHKIWPSYLELTSDIEFLDDQAAISSTPPKRLKVLFSLVQQLATKFDAEFKQVQRYSPDDVLNEDWKRSKDQLRDIGVMIARL